MTTESEPEVAESKRWHRTRARMAAASFGSLPPVQRGVVGVAVGAFLILWPNLALSVVVAVAGTTLVVLGLLGLVGSLRRGRASEVVRALLDTAVGVGLVVVSSSSVRLITLALIVGLLLRGIFDAGHAVRNARVGLPWAWYGLRSVAQIATAGAVAVFGEAIVAAILLLVGVSWLVGGVVAVATVRGRRRQTGAGLRDRIVDDTDPTHQLVVSWFQSRDVGAEARDAIVDKLVYAGHDVNRRVARYVSLMTFATAIAALGIQTDSTAVVIGAMLVAPLMTPIMATSLSLVLGLPGQAVRSLGAVAGGVAIAVGFSFLIARYAPGVIEIGVNSQITARTTPTLLDLLIALAAGCAGGYAVCRPDVSDSLPGVAIAVALVPPLAVVGITLAAGEFVLASGAFLLFLTNLVGIIVASGLIFATTGVAPWARLSENAAQLRRTSLTVFAALVLVSIPLAITGKRILADASNHEVALSTTQVWVDELLDDPDEGEAGGQADEGLPRLEIVRVDVDGDLVEVLLIGDEDIDDASGLSEGLSDALGRTVALEIRSIPETRISIPGE